MGDGGGPIIARWYGGQVAAGSIGLLPREMEPACGGVDIRCSRMAMTAGYANGNDADSFREDLAFHVGEGCC